MNLIVLEKINKNITKLQKETQIFRSFMVGLLAKDREGNYRSEFVKRITKISADKPVGTFKDKESFLRAIE